MPDYVAPSPDTWDRVARVVRTVESGLPSVIPDKRPQRDRDFVRQRFRNDSGETAPAYGVLRVTGTYDDGGVLIYTVGKPNTSFNRLYLVNGPNDVADDAFGWATWLWHADWVLYDDINTPAAGEGWGPRPTSWEIAKGYYGFQIRGGATGGDTPRVKAQQTEVDTVIGYLNAELVQGSSATTTVLGFASSLFDTGQTMTVNDWQLNASESVPTQTKTEAGWRGGQWVAINPYCASSDTIPSETLGGESSEALATEDGYTLALE